MPMHKAPMHKAQQRPIGWLACSAFFLAAAVPTPVLPQTQQAQAQLRAGASEIVFTTRQMGVPVEGRFTKFDAALALDPKNPQDGSVSLSIDTGSARFGSPELDAEVPKAGWLDAARFPLARFQSTQIKAVGRGRYEVRGRLTLKGQARDITVPVALQPSGAGLVQASGSFTIKRLDFAVGSGEWSDTSLLANDVNVRFKLVFSGLAAP